VPRIFPGATVSKLSMSAFTIFLALGVVLSFVPGAEADGIEPDGACAPAVARAVQGHYEAISDWSASFQQTRQAVAFSGGIAPPAEPTRTGTVVLAKPGRMRWSYVSPDPSLFVTDGRIVWMWDPLLGEAQRLSDAGGMLSQAAVRFLMGEGDLLEAFRVTAEDCAARPIRLDLVPKKDASYERLALEVDPDTGRVSASTVTDLFGNRTTVAFTHVQVNTEPDASQFRFDPPDGATVIDLAAPTPSASGAPERR